MTKKRRWEVLLPSDDNRNNETGRIIFYCPLPGLMIMDITILSERIPEELGTQNPYMKINCCLDGRCELTLKNGESFYLAGREVAIDTGQAVTTSDSFYYPNRYYTGIEIAIDQKQLIPSLKYFPNTAAAVSAVYNSCSLNQDRCQVATMDDECIDLCTRISACMRKTEEQEASFLMTLELLLLLPSVDYETKPSNRKYATKSQVDIAKETKRIIEQDLRLKHTAAELAENFGISESSLKNYFKIVYGSGFLEYQIDMRIRESCRMLADSDKKIADIAQAVGYSSQSKFTAVFKEKTGLTPLEYRRRKRLKDQ